MSAKSTSESLLIRLGDTEDSEAWSRFVELYTPLIFSWARKTGMQSQDASDLVQDVLAIVFRKLPEFNYDPQKSFRGWLRTITMNRFRELCRRRRPQLMGSSDSALGNVPDWRAAESTWDLDYARELVAAGMSRMRDDFAPQTWAALVALMNTGRPANEIANDTGVSVWTLYAARSRLLKRLREELEGLL